MKENPTYAAPDLETADPETDRQHAPARSRVHVTAGSRAARTGGQDLVDRNQVLAIRIPVALGRDPALEAEADLEARREAHSKAVTVASVLNDYERNVLASAVKQASRRKRIRVLRRAMAGFEGRAVASLTRGDFIKRLDQIQTEAGDVSRNRAQSEMRHFLGWCRDRDIVLTIALDRVRRGVRETPRDRALTDEELRSLIGAIGDGSAYSGLMRVLLHTAMRRNEAASLQARDLDFDARTITIRAEVSKTRQGRTVPMNDALVDMLRERLRGLKRDGFVFGEGSGFQRPFSGFSKAFARLWTTMPAETERWTLHDLRRTVATRLHQSGVDALVIEDLLGHLTGVRGGIAGVYNAATTLDRQRRALAGRSATLAALETPEPMLTGVARAKRKPSSPAAREGRRHVHPPVRPRA